MTASVLDALRRGVAIARGAIDRSSRSPDGSRCSPAFARVTRCLPPPDWLPRHGTQSIAARNGRGALAAAFGSCLALPAIGVLPAMIRSAPRCGALAVLIFAGTAGATMMVAGPEIVAGFVRTAVETATTYAFAPQNYGVAGRLAVDRSERSDSSVDARRLHWLLTWWRARTIDHAFAAFVALGLLVAPVVWSQHLALVFVPAVVLLIGVLSRGSSASLAHVGRPGADALAAGHRGREARCIDRPRSVGSDLSDPSVRARRLLGLDGLHRHLQVPGLITHCSQ